VADNAAAAGPGDSALAERYEQLRQAMLTGEGWPLGLGLLVTRGMAAWMRAWTDGPPPRAAVVRSVAPKPVTARAGEVVAVLAQMALAHV